MTEANWRYRPIEEWTDDQLEIRDRELEEEQRSEWCVTLILQARGRIARERTRPERLAARVSEAPAGLIGVRVVE